MNPIYHPGEFADGHRRMPGWVFSTLLHVVILVTLALLIQNRPKGTGAEPDRPVGIAVAHRMPDRTEYATQPDTQPNEAEQVNDAQSQAASAASALPADAAPPMDLEGLLAEAADSPLPDGIPGDGDAIEAPAASSTGASMELGETGSKHTTEVFGISGTGSRFLYVFDRSESMNGFGGRPLLAAKMQMIRSIRTLTTEQEFQIVFYNTQPRAFVPDGQMVRLLKGEEDSTRAAERYIRSMTAFGGTRHMDALLLALRMSPDVIFFLTDARVPRMNNAELQEIRERCLRASTTIHTIELGDDLEPPKDSFLRKLATDNGGQYKYLNVGTLNVN